MRAHCRAVVTIQGRHRDQSSHCLSMSAQATSPPRDGRVCAEQKRVTHSTTWCFAPRGFPLHHLPFHPASVSFRPAPVCGRGGIGVNRWLCHYLYAATPTHHRWVWIPLAPPAIGFSGRLDPKQYLNRPLGSDPIIVYIVDQTLSIIFTTSVVS